MRITNSSGTIVTQHRNYISNVVFNIYNSLNSKPFMDNISAYEEWKDTIYMVYDKFKVSHPHIQIISTPHYNITNDDKKIVLGFSGGLDSVYQAIWLKEHGYEVILYHLKGVNTYENGQATKCCPKIAGVLKLAYIESSFIKSRNAQMWPENAFKNELIMSLMIDYCIEQNIKYISLGDDFNLSINNSVEGINVTDARELTESFLLGVPVNIEFVKVEECDKLVRIKKLMDYGLEDFYYSCVQAGRFNQSLHRKTEMKYGAKLFTNNCGCYCRKCAMHNLLLYYGEIKKFPKEFIDRCWKILWDNSHSADYDLFKPDLSLEDRINNLFKY